MIPPKTFKFLLVDDDTDLCELIKLWCQSMKNINVIVEICDSGASAVQRLTQRRFDLVVLDLELPDLDGKTVYTFLKKTPLNHDTPVTILSGYLDINPWVFHTNETLLEKPTTSKEFKSALTKILSLDLIGQDYTPDAMAH